MKRVSAIQRKPIIKSRSGLMIPTIKKRKIQSPKRVKIMRHWGTVRNRKV